MLVDRIDLLRTAWAETMRAMPVRVDAIVVLPDHIHAVWTLPEGDDRYSERWRLVKHRFTRGLDARPMRSASKAAKRERGVWERTVRDEDERAAYVRYCWINPVKHGFVTRPSDWPYSSFHAAVRAGDVAADWGG